MRGCNLDLGRWGIRDNETGLLDRFRDSLLETVVDCLPLYGLREPNISTPLPRCVPPVERYFFSVLLLLLFFILLLRLLFSNLLLRFLSLFRRFSFFSPSCCLTLRRDRVGRAGGAAGAAGDDDFALPRVRACGTSLGSPCGMFVPCMVPALDAVWPFDSSVLDTAGTNPASSNELGATPELPIDPDMSLIRLGMGLFKPVGSLGLMDPLSPLTTSGKSLFGGYPSCSRETNIPDDFLHLKSVAFPKSSASA